MNPNEEMKDSLHKLGKQQRVDDLIVNRVIREIRETIKKDREKINPFVYSDWGVPKFYVNGISGAVDILNDEESTNDEKVLYLKVLMETVQGLEERFKEEI